MRYNKVRKILLFLSLFVGISAICGSICMFISPSGKLLQWITYFHTLRFYP